MRKLAVVLVTLGSLGTAQAGPDPFTQRKPPTSPVVKTPPPPPPVMATPAPPPRKPVVVTPAPTSPVVTPPGVVAPQPPIAQQDEPCNCDVIDRGKSRRLAAKWTAAGGVALVGVSFAVSYYARSRYDEVLERADSEGRIYNDDEVRAANHWQSIARNVATPIFMAGGIALGTAIVLYVTAPDKIVRERAAFVPAVSHDSVGFAVSGGF
ncbi:MAG TPA: hypothetical protein VIV11_28125 [Kofleriaceae bacterium]